MHVWAYYTIEYCNFPWLLRCHSDMCFPGYRVSRTHIPRDVCFPANISLGMRVSHQWYSYVSLYDFGIFMSITNITRNVSMYNCMNAAYLAKLTYEISLSFPSFKISPSKISHYAHKPLTCYIERFLYDSVKNVVIYYNCTKFATVHAKWPHNISYWAFINW